MTERKLICIDFTNKTCLATCSRSPTPLKILHIQSNFQQSLDISSLIKDSTSLVLLPFATPLLLLPIRSQLLRSLHISSSIQAHFIRIYCEDRKSQDLSFDLLQLKNAEITRRIKEIN